MKKTKQSIRPICGYLVHFGYISNSYDRIQRLSCISAKKWLKWTYDHTHYK